jgi:hypothetical protein
MASLRRFLRNLPIWRRFIIMNLSKSLNKYREGDKLIYALERFSCHPADFHETRVCLTFRQELMYRISWKSDKQFIRFYQATNWRTCSPHKARFIFYFLKDAENDRLSKITGRFKHDSLRRRFVSLLSFNVIILRIKYVNFKLKFVFFFCFLGLISVKWLLIWMNIFKISNYIINTPFSIYLFYVSLLLRLAALWCRNIIIALQYLPLVHSVVLY